MMKSFSVKNNYHQMAFSLYMNFFVHGIGVIAIAQNMNSLMIHFGTNPAGIVGVISGMGLGRCASYILMGYISDRLGRRFIITLGLFIYMLFFVGIAFSPNLQIAFCCAFIGGVANACFDTGVYPALMEAYPRAPGSSVILCKAAMSVGQFLYPLFVGYLLAHKSWYGIAFLVPAGILLINFALLNKAPFPAASAGKKEVSLMEKERLTKEEKNNTPKLRNKANILVDGLAIALFGCLIYSTFYAFVLWIPKYAAQFAGVDEITSLSTVSAYGLGSFIAVFVSSIVLHSLIRSVFVMVLFPFCAAIAIAFIYLYPSPQVCYAGAFVVGFTAAGGVLQLGVAIMSDFFPSNKAKLTGIYMFFGSLANFGIPLITGEISKISIRYIMLFTIGMASLSIILGVYVFIRYYKLFSISKNDVRIGEKFFATVDG